MTRLRREIAVRRDAATAWRLVGDPSRYDDVLVGVTRWEPSGPDRYWVLMRVGAVATGGEVEVSLDAAARRVRWHAVRGTRTDAVLDVVDDGPGHCRIRLDVHYGLEGPLGPLASRAMRPMVGRALVASLETARHLVEHELSDDAAGGR